VPIACRNKVVRGPQFCVTDCPASAPGGVFRYVRVERPEDLPPTDERVVDVAVLDMNHGRPNLGHDSLVHAVLDTSCDLIEPLADSGIGVRVVSYDVRRAGMIPEAPGGRFALYLGTGGPAHIDPHRNDGVSEASQGIAEDPSWEKPLFTLFDAVAADKHAALLGVCHTFGVMCRWSGAAAPRLRGEDKGGKSSGVLENVLTAEAERHPWFARFARELGPRRRLRIIDNRLFDLIPSRATFAQGFVPIGYETLGVGGPRGDALTMLEFSRDAAGLMPRVFGVNHHPEIVDRGRQRLILEQKHERGEVSEEWYRERALALSHNYPDENSDRRLHVTSDYTLLGPLRYYIYRQVRLRAQALGKRVDVHEDRLPEEAARDAAAAV
jgi:hypothetical protein